MENFTKEELLATKSIVTQVLKNKRADNRSNLNNTTINFYNEVYTKGVTLGLSAIAFDDNALMKAITILSGILTYEELKYILTNLKSYIVTTHKLQLLNQTKYDKLLKLLTNEEIKDINYQRMEDEIRGPRK